MSSDYSHANLQGRSFKGQNLAGSDFTQADIRGANFAHANLMGANLNQVKAGVQHYWVVGLAICALLLALISGCISGVAGAMISSLGMVFTTLEREPTVFELFATTALPVIMLLVFGFVVVYQGLGRALGIGGAVTVTGVVLIIVITLSLETVDPTLEAGADISSRMIGLVFSRSILVLGAIGGTIVGAIAVFMALTLAQIWLVVLVGVTTTLGAIAILPATLIRVPHTALEDWLWIGTVILTLELLSAYMGRQAFKGNKKYALVQNSAVSLSSRGGTSFRGANLTDANFSQATLKSTDFRQALLYCTNWFQTQKLDQARLDGTYLADSSIRDLVVTKNGHEQIFDRQDLRSLNLQDANLTDASFIGADLSGANLQNADLSRAKLVKAQLYHTNLARATLTGAYIQDWAISIDTQLAKVTCDYIYMRLPTKEDPDPGRKPDNRQRTFAAGEFTDFISPIIKTLDLYQQQNVDMLDVAATTKSLDLFHQGGIDPSAAAVALKQLAERFPDAGLEVVALEGRGNERVRVQARVTGDADRSQLSEAYFAQYQQVESMPQGDIQALLRGIEEKDERIRSLESMVMSALKEDKYYVESIYNLGDNVAESSINISAGGNIGDVSGVVAGDVSGVLNLGTISGDVTTSINQLPDTASPDEPGLKELLLQLQASIEAESELPPEDKAEALEQVKVLAEVGQDPETEPMKKAGKTAMKILKGTATILAPTTQLVQEFAKLLPAVSSLLLLL